MVKFFFFLRVMTLSLKKKKNPCQAFFGGDNLLIRIPQSLLHSPFSFLYISKLNLAKKQIIVSLFAFHQLSLNDISTLQTCLLLVMGVLSLE